MQDDCLSEIQRNKSVREYLEVPLKTTPSPTTLIGQHIGQVTHPKPLEMTVDSNLDINDVIDAIDEISCPNECSENGLCENGTYFVEGA